MKTTRETMHRKRRITLRIIIIRQHEKKANKKNKNNK